MSPGGMPFESAPFFARADAARSAIDDAVSNPLHMSAAASLSHAISYRIQTAHRLGTSKAGFMRFSVRGVVSGVPSKGGRQSEPQGRESSSLSCCCTAHRLRLHPQVRSVAHPELSAALYASCSNRSPSLSRPAITSDRSHQAPLAEDPMEDDRICQSHDKQEGGTDGRPWVRNF